MEKSKEPLSDEAFERAHLLALVLSGSDQSEPYYVALGRFVSGFSDLETSLVFIIWQLAGISPPIAPALVGGVRIEQGLAQIKRLVSLQNWSEENKEKLEYLTLQIGEINATRNDLLHFGSKAAGLGWDTWEVTNEPFVYDKTDIRKRMLSAKILRQMTSDLFEIRIHLNYLFFRDSMLTIGQKGFNPRWFQPWQYKSDVQRPNPKKTQKRKLRQIRQRLADRAKAPR